MCELPTLQEYYCFGDLRTGSEWTLSPTKILGKGKTNTVDNLSVPEPPKIPTQLSQNDGRLIVTLPALANGGCRINGCALRRIVLRHIPSILTKPVSRKNGIVRQGE